MEHIQCKSSFACEISTAAPCYPVKYTALVIQYKLELSLKTDWTESGYRPLLYLPVATTFSLKPYGTQTGDLSQPNKVEKWWQPTGWTVLICRPLLTAGPNDTVCSCWHQIGQPVKWVRGCKWKRWHCLETRACTRLLRLGMKPARMDCDERTG